MTARPLNIVSDSLDRLQVIRTPMTAAILEPVSTAATGAGRIRKLSPCEGESFQDFRNSMSSKILSTASLQRVVFTDSSTSRRHHNPAAESFQIFRTDYRVKLPNIQDKALFARQKEKKKGTTGFCDFCWTKLEGPSDNRTMRGFSKSFYVVCLGNMRKIAFGLTARSTGGTI